MFKEEKYEEGGILDLLKKGQEKTYFAELEACKIAFQARMGELCIKDPKLSCYDMGDMVATFIIPALKLSIDRSNIIHNVRGGRMF